MKSRPVITLLTDFGEGSYVASVKGVLLSLEPEVAVVDVTHRVEPGAVGSAGFLLSHTAPYFPKGTVHVAIVDPGVGTARSPIIVEAGEAFFVGPDNGLFGEVIRRSKGARAYKVEEGPWLPDKLSPTFHGRDLFARVAGRLARGASPERFGSPIAVEKLVPSPIPPPSVRRNGFLGQVVWVDHFGNLITNLKERNVEEWAADQPFRAVVGWERVDRMIRTFQETERGNLAILYGSWETLEIVVSEGSAASRLGVSIGEPVRLEKVDGD